MLNELACFIVARTVFIVARTFAFMSPSPAIVIPFFIAIAMSPVSLLIVSVTKVVVVNIVNFNRLVIDHFVALCVPDVVWLVRVRVCVVLMVSSMVRCFAMLMG